MNSFIGEYSHTLDAKGRLIIPVKYRNDLGDNFVVTKGYDDCLWIYPMVNWEEFKNKLMNLPKINKAAGNILRHFLAGATDCELDKQGRILLPANLREFAYLDKEVILAGVGDRIEIWSKAKWTQNLDNIDIRLEEENLEKAGITI